MIFGLPSLTRNQPWRGVAWIALQIALVTLASELRSVRRDEGDNLAALLASAGSLGLSVWAGIVMPRAFSAKAEQFGPIGVTFALFTLILAATLVIVIAPLMVAVGEHRRDGIAELPAEGDA